MYKNYRELRIAYTNWQAESFVTLFQFAAYNGTTEKGECRMNNLRCAAKLIGLTILAFGLGLLLSFFLPEGFLVVIEAVVIIGIGFLYFSVK